MNEFLCINSILCLFPLLNMMTTTTGMSNTHNDVYLQNLYDEDDGEEGEEQDLQFILDSVADVISFYEDRKSVVEADN